MKSTQASKWTVTVLVFALAVAFGLSAQDAAPTPKQNTPVAAQSSSEQTVQWIAPRKLRPRPAPPQASKRTSRNA